MEAKGEGDEDDRDQNHGDVVAELRLSRHEYTKRICEEEEDELKESKKGVRRDHLHAKLMEGHDLCASQGMQLFSCIIISKSKLFSGIHLHDGMH